MTINPIRLGLIGGGINSAVGRTHFTAAQMDGLFRVHAGCFSRDAEINAKTADRWGLEPLRVHSSWESMLEKERGRIDAVVVLTPTLHHQAPVISALRAGFPVICEKALAGSSREAAEMEQVAKETGRLLAVTYNYTGYPMVRELREMILHGRLGCIKQFHVEMPQEGFLRLDREGNPIVPQQWRLVDGVVPTISLDLGVHVHQLIDFLIGEKPKEVVATQSSLGRFRQVVDTTMAILRYGNGIEGNLWFSKAALGHRNGLRVRIYGEEGSAEWCQIDPEFIHFSSCTGQQLRIDRASPGVIIAHLDRYNRFKSGHPAGFLEAFANLYADIASLMGKGIVSDTDSSRYIFTASQAREGLVMLEALHRSANERRWINIDLGT
jgi:predicted dehydrogenase